MTVTQGGIEGAFGFIEQRIEIEDPKDCGAGEGPDCCAYLVFDPIGMTFLCGRETTLRFRIQERLAEGSMSATRDPKLPFPECQKEGR